MASIAPIVPEETWDLKLRNYRRELVGRVALLIFVALSNIALITYAGYRLYQVIPFSWTKAVVYTPLIAGLILTVIVYRKILHKGAKDYLPQGINERNISYYNPMLLISSILSFGLLLPTVFMASITDRTNYGRSPQAEATASRLRTHSFQSIAFEEGSRYKTLIRLGFIQEFDEDDNPLTLDNFTLVKGVLQVNPEQLPVKKWIKKARDTIYQLEIELLRAETKQKEAPNSERIKNKIIDIKDSIALLNGLWEKRSRDICPEYLGEIDYKLNWFERHFLRNSIEIPDTNRYKAEKSSEASTPTAASSNSLVVQHNFTFV